MKRIFYILTLVTLSVALSGCYSNYKTPPEEKIWEDFDFVGEGYQIIDIQTLKEMYTSVYVLDNLPNFVMITEPVVIKGKVTSNDRPGNFYRNMMIQDASGAIEIKVGKGSLQNEYRVGQTVYVIAQDLVLGNYRYNLSLGSATSDAKYANDYIDLQQDIDFHIRKGYNMGLTADDILVVNASNYTNLGQQDVGRLVRFEGLTHTHGSMRGTQYPSFLQTTPIPDKPAADPIYTDRPFTTVINDWRNYYVNGGLEPQGTIGISNGGDSAFVPYPYLPNNRLYPTWGYHSIESGDSFYGSAYFKYSNAGAAPTGGAGDAPVGHYVVRSSGYSKFANEPLPSPNAVVNLTGFFNKYCSGGGGYQIYQLVINNNADVELVSGTWANE